MPVAWAWSGSDAAGRPRSESESHLTVEHRRFGRSVDTIQSLAGTQEGLEAVALEGRTVENLPAAHADAHLFQTLGIRPSAGRFFTEEEDSLPDGVAVAVISDGLARRAFGSPDAALDALLLNGQRLSVVGVAPMLPAASRPSAR